MTHTAHTPGPWKVESTAELELLEALKMAKGYMVNAAIDLNTGAPKKTALATLNGGLVRVDEAIKRVTGGNNDAQR